MESVVEAMGSPLTAEDVNSACSELTECVFKMYGAKECTPDQLDLDNRCCSTLRVGDGFIAVDAASDRRLQYYGGFEYVRNEHKATVGDYVFYFTTDSRVKGHWECAMEGEEHDDDEQSTEGAEDKTAEAC